MSSLHAYRQKEPEIASEGGAVGVLIEFLDLGTTYTKWDKHTRQVRLTFEIEELMSSGLPFVLGITVSLTLGTGKKSKARLREALEAIQGRVFTTQELKGDIDFAKFLGRACMLSIIHAENDEGRTYAKIASIGAVPKNYNVPEPVNELKFLGLGEDFDQEVFDSLPQWIQDRIKESDEFKAMQKPSDEDVDF